MSRLTNCLLVGSLIVSHGCIGDADDASEVDSEDLDLTYTPAP